MYDADEEGNIINLVSYEWPTQMYHNLLKNATEKNLVKTLENIRHLNALGVGAQGWDHDGEVGAMDMVLANSQVRRQLYTYLDTETDCDVITTDGTIDHWSALTLVKSNPGVSDDSLAIFTDILDKTRTRMASATEAVKKKIRQGHNNLVWYLASSMDLETALPYLHVLAEYKLHTFDVTGPRSRPIFNAIMSQQCNQVVKAEAVMMLISETNYLNSREQTVIDGLIHSNREWTITLLGEVLGLLEMRYVESILPRINNLSYSSTDHRNSVATVFVDHLTKLNCRSDAFIKFIMNCSHEFAIRALDKVFNGKQDDMMEVIRSYLNTTRVRKTDECCVCRDAAANIVIIPCGHQSVCALCVWRLKKCPVCKGEKKSMLFIDEAKKTEKPMDTPEEHTEKPANLPEEEVAVVTDDSGYHSAPDDRPRKTRSTRGYRNPLVLRQKCEKNIEQLNARAKPKKSMIPILMRASSP